MASEFGQRLLCLQRPGEMSPGCEKPVAPSKASSRRGREGQACRQQVRCPQAIREWPLPTRQGPGSPWAEAPYQSPASIFCFQPLWSGACTEPVTEPGSPWPRRSPPCRRLHCHPQPLPGWKVAGVGGGTWAHPSAFPSRSALRCWRKSPCSEVCVTERGGPGRTSPCGPSPSVQHPHTPSGHPSTRPSWGQALREQPVVAVLDRRVLSGTGVSDGDSCCCRRPLELVCREPWTRPCRAAELWVPSPVCGGARLRPLGTRASLCPTCAQPLSWSP